MRYSLDLGAAPPLPVLHPFFTASGLGVRAAAALMPQAGADDRRKVSFLAGPGFSTMAASQSMNGSGLNAETTAPITRTDWSIV